MTAFSRWIDVEVIEVELLLVEDAKDVLVEVPFVEAGDVEVIEVELLFTEDGDAKDVLVKVTFVEAGDVEAGGK